MIFWRVLVGKRLLPPNELWKKEPQLFNVSGIGYCFDSKYKDFARWRPFKRADYHCAKSLYDNIKTVGWIDKLLSETQNGSHAGMRIDKPIINNTEMKRQYIDVKWLKSANGRKQGTLEKMVTTKASQFIKLGLVKEVKTEVVEVVETLEVEKEDNKVIKATVKRGRKPNK